MISAEIVSILSALPFTLDLTLRLRLRLRLGQLTSNLIIPGSLESILRKDKAPYLYFLYREVQKGMFLKCFVYQKALI